MWPHHISVPTSVRIAKPHTLLVLTLYVNFRAEMAHWSWKLSDRFVGSHGGANKLSSPKRKGTNDLGGIQVQGGLALWGVQVQGELTLWGFFRFAVILRSRSCVSGRRSCARTSTSASGSDSSGPSKSRKVGCGAEARPHLQRL